MLIIANSLFEVRRRHQKLSFAFFSFYKRADSRVISFTLLEGYLDRPASCRTTRHENCNTNPTALPPAHGDLELKAAAAVESYELAGLFDGPVFLDRLRQIRHTKLGSKKCRGLEANFFSYFQLWYRFCPSYPSFLYVRELHFPYPPPPFLPRTSTLPQRLPRKTRQHEARPVDLLVVIPAQLLLLFRAPAPEGLLNIALGVLAAYHEADLARGVCRNGGVGVFDGGEDFQAGFAEITYEAEVEPLVFS